MLCGFKLSGIWYSETEWSIQVFLLNYVFQAYYIKSWFRWFCLTHNYRIRNVVNNSLSIHRAIRSRCQQYLGYRIVGKWNSIPFDIRNSNSFVKCKKSYKTYLVNLWLNNNNKVNWTQSKKIQRKILYSWGTNIPTHDV